MSSRAMVVVAGGSSTRFGGDKLLALVAGRPLIAHTVDAVAPHVERCVVACRPDHIAYLESIGLPATLVPGGSTRTASEMAGLAALGGEPDLIGIHDGARPLAGAALIEAVFEAAAEHGGAAPFIASDRLFIDRASGSPVPGLGTVQTPQVFRNDVLMASYVKAAQTGFEGHDTIDVVTRFSDQRVAAVPGDPRNVKVTFRSDLDWVAEALADRGRI